MWKLRTNRSKKTNYSSSLPMRRWGLTLALFGLALGSTGCGKEEFLKQQYIASASAIGYRTIPAKVDIVMVVDNTGSISSAFNTLQPELNSFVSSLSGKYWDYHVARVLISNPAPITKVLVDPRFNQSKLPDGTPNPSTDLVPASAAVTSPSQFTLLSPGEIGGALVTDPTYTSLVNTVKAARDNNTTGFFRRDAILAIIVVTNGVAREVLSDAGNPQGPLDAAKLATWASNISRLKTDVGMSDDLIRFYPVVSPRFRPDGCFGSGANSGASYLQMLTNYFQGTSGDVCDANALSSVLGNIEGDLDLIREALITSYIVSPKPLDANNLAVYKNNSATPLPKGGANGWNYLGYVDENHAVCTVTAIESGGGEIPICANIRSGYLIKLSGDARLHGNDTYRLEYIRAD